MKATYLDKYEDLNSTYYDLYFEESDEILMRLSGVIFDKQHTFENLQERALEISKEALPEHSLTETTIQ